MSRSHLHGNRALAVACAFAVSFTCMPTAVWASDEPDKEQSTLIRSSAKRIGAVEGQRLLQPKRQSVARSATAQPQSQPSPELERGSFFRSPAGVAVIAVFGVGLGYAVYSASNDRIRSTGR